MRFRLSRSARRGPAGSKTRLRKMRYPKRLTDIAAEAEADEADAKRVAAAEAEAAEWKDKYLRLHAEWDNYRRRTTEQRDEEKIRATEKLMEDLLSRYSTISSVRSTTPRKTAKRDCLAA